MKYLEFAESLIPPINHMTTLFNLASSDIHSIPLDRLYLLGGPGGMIVNGGPGLMHELRILCTMLGYFKLYRSFQSRDQVAAERDRTILRLQLLLEIK